MSNTEITTQSVLARNPEINFTDMGGEIVMMSIDQGEFYGLDDIATDIWNRLEEKMAVHNLCKDLCASYGIDTEQCLTDILPFLDEMVADKLINIS